MDKFTIGGKEYPVKISYRIRRYWVDWCSLPRDEDDKMTLADSDDKVLGGLLLCLPDNEFPSSTDELRLASIEKLKDLLSDDEFKEIEAFFLGIIRNQKLKEGMTDIEKKPE